MKVIECERMCRCRVGVQHQHMLNTRHA